MSRGWLCALALSGCRVWFDDVPRDAAIDATACIPASPHDDDDDGVADSCDVCPDVADAQADADGDGVGDACDPSATTREQRTIFDTFETFDARWSGGAWVQGSDQIERDNRDGGNGLIMMTDHANRTFAWTGAVLATGTAVGGKQIAIQFDPGTGVRYYCELYGSTTQELKIRSTDQSPDRARIVIDPSVYPTGTFRIAMRLDAGELVCDLTFEGVPYQVRALAPTIVPSTRVFLNVIDVHASLDMFTMLVTDPS